MTTSTDNVHTVHIVVATIVLICGILRWIIYCTQSEPNESMASFNTRVQYGDLRPPAIKARMEQDPEFRRRMGALLSTIEYRLKAGEVKTARGKLLKTIEAAKHFSARVKAADATRQAAEEEEEEEAAAAAATEGANGSGGRGGGGSGGGAAGARARLLAASRDEASVNAKVTALAAEYRAAKVAVVRLMMAVANQPQGARERAPRRAPPTREAAAAATAVVEMSGRASRGTGTGAFDAAAEAEEASGAARMEEGRPLL